MFSVCTECFLWTWYYSKSLKKGKCNWEIDCLGVDKLCQCLGRL